MAHSPQGLFGSTDCGGIFVYHPFVVPSRARMATKRFRTYFEMSVGAHVVGRIVFEVMRPFVPFLL